IIFECEGAGLHFGSDSSRGEKKADKDWEETLDVHALPPKRASVSPAYMLLIQLLVHAGLAASHPSTSTDAQLSAREDCPPNAANRRGGDQEHGLCASYDRERPRGFSVDRARDSRGGRRSESVRGPSHRGIERRRNSAALQSRPRRRLRGHRLRSALTRSRRPAAAGARHRPPEKTNF